MQCSKSISNTHTYNFGSTEINFIYDEPSQLSVTIDTDRLHLRTVESTEKYYQYYDDLFSDSIVMSKFATGQTKAKNETIDRINNVWVKRWNEKDPYNGLAVFNKDMEFIGHVVLGHGDKPGRSELAYLFMKNHWNKGYATEAVTAVVKQYAPATLEEGFLLENAPLKKINATARLDNVGSIKILEKIGMQKKSEEEKFGALRYLYSIKLSELMTSQ